MCGTARKPSSAETCSYCGYIFEDSLSSRGFSAPSSNQETEIPDFSEGSTTSATAFGETPLRTMINVICRNSRSVKDGSLILTNRRLAFVTGKLDTTDTKDISKILQGGEVLEIPLDQVVNVTGNRGILRPSLNVVWRNQPGSDETTKTEFIQNYRPKNLEEARNGINEWVPFIEKAAVPDDEGSLQPTGEPIVDEKELKSRVLDELGDSQWKGFFQISKDLREKYDISVDPDRLEGICQEMVKEKILEQDKYGAFFRKIQPTKK
jgi:hypothetical protein